MLPDHNKPLADNLDALSDGLKQWATVLAAASHIPAGSASLKTMLKTVSGGLHLAANVAAQAALEARKES